MALDTRSKRFSMMNISQSWEVNLPNPSGSFDQGDRQQILHGYSGIGWGAGIEHFEEYPLTFNIEQSKLLSFGTEQSNAFTFNIEQSGEVLYDI